MGLNRLRPAEFRRKLHPLPARHDDVARRYAKLPVMTAAALDHIDGPRRQTLRQVANVTIYRHAHDTLQVPVTTKTDGSSVAFPENHDPLKKAVSRGG
jgi:hypothetical protein